MGSAGSRIRSGDVCVRWSKLAERRCVLDGGEALRRFFEGIKMRLYYYVLKSVV